MEMVLLINEFVKKVKFQYQQEKKRLKNKENSKYM